MPLAGAVIGASSNAVMIYALGYTACQFYEAKVLEIISKRLNQNLAFSTY
ncbi:hypothetical protein NOS3756_52760 [Nostoc sp. NIES-3756]|nr:hypothetical protein [Nostoc sp. NIES-3756]BAT56273.1 hypothetical protein NOS3756_52760 [Nostoc sp. NIES-3756]